ncbi:hypothetical protein [Hoyosella altamirensis]|uniref:Uncharacterized protein n=1 Tax=Hoyosella altamirensis TaxID=616997 RepID=A0A839RLI2_9ACTN|nr:hypothetical protein [Hoyosella altamirensis]MBB3036956.1 hypothetical protein [Hoyosella altamirensis]
MSTPQDPSRAQAPGRSKALTATGHASQAIAGFVAGAFVWAGLFRGLYLLDVWVPWYLMLVAPLIIAAAGLYAARRSAARITTAAWAFLAGTLGWTLAASGAVLALMLAVS